MRAVLIEEHGGPEVLEVRKAPNPEIGPLEALIKVWACGVNHVDLYLRQGIIGANIPLPAIPGREVAGEIVEVGELVRDFGPGDRVTVIPRFPCGNCEPCRIGEEGMCLQAASIPGGYAEFTTAPASSLITLPPEVSYDQGASVALAYLTAWHMLITRAKVRSGEDVLVHAAGSGVGSGAIQIAKMAGARVIATASSDIKLERARQIGADETINYSKDDFKDSVMGLTEGRGVDIVVEHIGTDTWQGSIGCLAFNGRLVTSGAHTGVYGRINIQELFIKQLTIIGSYLGSRHELAQLLKVIAQGKVKPAIDSVYPLEGAKEAHQMMEERRQFGKLLIKPWLK